MQKFALPPIIPEDVRLLILGSLPGDVSLASREYYAHPRNQFWDLLAILSGRDFRSKTYAERLDLLAEARVGLWDVVAQGHRAGSLDTALRNVALNDLACTVRALPSLAAVAFNGRKAAALGRPQLSGMETVQLIDLPSSSPAFTLAREIKAEAWNALAPFFVVPVSNTVAHPSAEAIRRV